MNNFLQGLMNYHFVQNALISSVLIGAVAGMIGCFIILRGMSLMGDAISHFRDYFNRCCKKFNRLIPYFIWEYFSGTRF